MRAAALVDADGGARVGSPWASAISVGSSSTCRRAACVAVERSASGPRSDKLKFSTYDDHEAGVCRRVHYQGLSSVPGAIRIMLDQSLSCFIPELGLKFCRSAARLQTRRQHIG